MSDGDERLSRISLILWIVALLISGVLYVLDLGQGSLWNSDDALYGEVIRQILASGDFRSLWFDYDIARAYPLGMAAMAAICGVLGVSELSLRLFSLITCFGCLALFVAVSSQPIRRTGAAFVSMALLAGQPLFFSISQRVLHDGLMLMLFVAAEAVYQRSLSSERAHHWRIAAGVICGLASLVKIGVGALPMAVIVVDLLISDRRAFRHGSTWAALTASVVIPLTYVWSIGALWDSIGALGHRVFVGLPGHVGSEAPRLFFLEVIAGQGYQGVILLVLSGAGLVFAVRRRTETLRLMSVWLIVSFVALLVVRTNLPRYSVMLMLPAALLCGELVSELSSKYRLLAVVLPIAAGLMVIGTTLSNPWVHHLNDNVAQLSSIQGGEPSDSYLCTIEYYHASPVYYSERKVEYLTENPRALEILRRTFGEETVPTLSRGEIARRLSRQERFACIIPREMIEIRLSELTGIEVIEPDPDLMGNDIVLIRKR